MAGAAILQRRIENRVNNIFYHELVWPGLFVEVGTDSV